MKTDSSSKRSDKSAGLPPPPASVHAVGIGGIGMSGLAQLLLEKGYSVSGSDRDSGRDENRRIISSLEAQGIEIFSQDGSGPRCRKPDVLIYSTAVEEGNPDFTACPGIPRLHRADALAAAISDGNVMRIAVAGSCGKTTVSAWAAETMELAGLDPTFLVGGLLNRYSDDKYCGNFRSGKGPYFLFEADESDKSLLRYRPDYSMILNVGTDHYEKAELLRVFREFLGNTLRGAVIESSLLAQLGPESYSHLDVRTFSPMIGGDDVPSDWRLASCSMAPNGSVAETSSGLRFELPVPGVHNALNGLAILALFDLIGVPGAVPRDIAPLLSRFRGVWRRFEIHGKTRKGATVVDDYAHNVEKILSAIRTARALVRGTLFVVFQPHGFGPLKFMEPELHAALESDPGNREIFAFLPVFYSGGTAAFTPTSAEVVERYSSMGKRTYLSFERRDDAADYVRSRLGEGDAVLILGARDNSLSDWARQLVDS
jgi:UDP-N-acetylmuramate--alanine ligase